MIPQIRRLAEISMMIEVFILFMGSVKNLANFCELFYVYYNCDYFSGTFILIACFDCMTSFDIMYDLPFL